MRMLLLAGSGEARRVADRLAEMPEVEATASIVGATRSPELLEIPTRIGGFGGAAGFAAYIRQSGTQCVLDATHPFAARITARTTKICRELSLPHAILCRPGWTPVAGDDWTFIDREQDAASLIPEGATVFLGTGPLGLASFANLTNRRIICRRIDPPGDAFPFSGGEYLVGRPPFSVEDEVALFQKLSVDWLVVKNSGGEPSRTKLDAARNLGIKVALLNRPPLPEATILTSVGAALVWLEQQR